MTNEERLKIYERVQNNIKKEQCCPPSSYREVHESTIMAENEVLAVAQLKGNEIEIKSIKLEH